MLREEEWRREMAKIENSYEFMLNNLNTIVDDLENGNLTLEEAIEYLNN